MDIRQDEQKLLLEQNYDGIRELDNLLPSWWKNLFYVTICFSGIYFFGYQVFGWFDSQSVEFITETANFDKMVNENAQVPTMPVEQALQDGSIRAAGKKVFLETCTVCHVEDGGGNIGPNLTDDYWINGSGTFEEIRNVVTNGVINKNNNNMPSWKAVLGNRKIFQVAVHVVSLRGTKPANPKPPEGTLKR